MVGLGVGARLDSRCNSRRRRGLGAWRRWLRGEVLGKVAVTMGLRDRDRRCGRRRRGGGLGADHGEDVVAVLLLLGVADGARWRGRVRLSWACWAPAWCGRLDAEEGARGLKQGGVTRSSVGDATDVATARWRGPWATSWLGVARQRCGVRVAVRGRGLGRGRRHHGARSRGTTAASRRGRSTSQLHARRWWSMEGRGRRRPASRSRWPRLGEGGFWTWTEAGEGDGGG